jgi:hypothetical protein
MARQVRYIEVLKQIGHALAMYVQDYDQHFSVCCSWGRAATDPSTLTGSCSQIGITRATPNNTDLGPEQTPPRYIQELLHLYIRDARIWFCPSVQNNSIFLGTVGRSGKDRTVAYNGTSYVWNWDTDPTTSTDPNPFRMRKSREISGLALAAIPRPAKACTLFESAPWNPVKEPCTTRVERPAHELGLNVLYADHHVKFSRFSNRASPADPHPGHCTENQWAEHNWEGYYN